MKVSRDISDVGRKSLMLLSADSFEEERILNMLEKIIRSGGCLEMEADDGRSMKAAFNKKELA